MAIELVIPSAGESVTKVLIGAWHKQEGQRVEKDETIVEIETDKATMEVPSPVAGVLGKVLKKAGEPANVGDVIGVIEAGAGAANTAGAGAGAASAGSNTPAVAGATMVATGRTASAGGTGGGDAARGSATAVASPPGVAARVMPAAQRVLAENHLKPGDIAASGPGGRLLKEDVLRHLEGGVAGNRPGVVEGDGRPAGGVAAPVAVASPAVRSAAYTGLNAAVEAAGPRHEEPVLMTPMRQKIAQRLVDAQHTAAILTTFNEVDLTAVMVLRKEHQEAFEKKYKLKLGFMSFFVKAAIDALKLIPQVNAEIRVQPGADGQPAPHVVYRNYYDIGVAVSGGKGLVVPVIRNAERLSFAEIEMVIADFGARARDNKIKLDELTGGTFTISNGGIFGSLMSTPILNPPQSGILGMHAIQERPVARDGQVVVRPMMYIALSYDHRIIDGREAVTFLKRIKECVENPARMLIEV